MSVVTVGSSNTGTKTDNDRNYDEDSIWGLKRNLRRNEKTPLLKFAAPEKWRILIKLTQTMIRKHEEGRPIFVRPSEIEWNKEHSEREYNSAYVSAVLQELEIAKVIERADKFDHLSPRKYTLEGIEQLLKRLRLLEDEANQMKCEEEEIKLWISRIQKLRQALHKLKTINQILFIK